MQSQKSELEQIQSLKAEHEKLKLQVADLATLQSKFDALTIEVQALRSQAASTVALGDEVKQLKETLVTYQANAGTKSPASSFNPVKNASVSG